MEFYSCIKIHLTCASYLFIVSCTSPFNSLLCDAGTLYFPGFIASCLSVRFCLTERLEIRRWEKRRDLIFLTPVIPEQQKTFMATPFYIPTNTRFFQHTQYQLPKALRGTVPAGCNPLTDYSISHVMLLSTIYTQVTHTNFYKSKPES